MNRLIAITLLAVSWLVTGYLQIVGKVGVIESCVVTFACGMLAGYLGRQKT